MPGKWEFHENHSVRRSPRSPGLDVSLSVLTLLLALVSSRCADPERYDPPPQLDGGSVAGCAGADCAPLPASDCDEPGPGCPCDVAGEHLVCGHVESQVASQIVCGKGYSVCADGVWAPCLINNTAPLLRAAPAPGASRALSLGAPIKCVNNPCDPSCWDFLDTPIGEGNPNAGLSADAAGITLLAGGPPLGLYAAADFVRDYDATKLCAPGTTPLWGLWSWKAITPSGTSIAFSAQTAASAAEASKAPVDALLFSDPPGPSSLAGKPALARLGPPNTTAGSAVVDTTLVKHGRLRGLPFLRITARLAPSSDGKSAPLLAAWDLQVSCAPSE